jgi:hypothetical protein
MIGIVLPIVDGNGETDGFTNPLGVTLPLNANKD